MQVVGRAEPQERAEFIRKTYTHLAGAVGAFILVETFLIQSGLAASFASLLTGRYTWLAILGGFSLLGWMSRELASKYICINMYMF